MPATNNPNPRTDWQIGEKCWYIRSWNDTIACGYIADIKLSGSPLAFAEIHNVYNGRPVTTECHLDQLFTSKDAALAAYEQSQYKPDYNAIIKQYRDEIHTPADLIQFAWDHPIASGPDTDRLARAVFQQKAMELMGLSLIDKNRQE